MKAALLAAVPRGAAEQNVHHPRRSLVLCFLVRPGLGCFLFASGVSNEQVWCMCAVRCDRDARSAVGLLAQQHGRVGTPLVSCFFVQ